MWQRCMIPIKRFGLETKRTMRLERRRQQLPRSTQEYRLRWRSMQAEIEELKAELKGRISAAAA
jgi:hypothetical protein